MTNNKCKCTECAEPCSASIPAGATDQNICSFCKNNLHIRKKAVKKL